LVWTTARAIDAGESPDRLRRLVSESKKFATEASWTIVNHAMQILGGIGYTDVYPVERLLRDARLGLIWTGTSEIMDLIIQHEVYRELGAAPIGRDVEADATAADWLDDKVYE
jgi:alkylation response protein AidB-like acyl-CoA dehydrogenase